LVSNNISDNAFTCLGPLGSATTLRTKSRASHEKAAHKLFIKLTIGGSMGPRYVLPLLFSEKSQN
jgi:hypothetical protein